MGSNSAGEEDQAHAHQHSGQVWEIKRERLESMQKKISGAPKLLAKWAGRSSCCIFRVPQSLVDVNGATYRPHIVSIGPFHRGEPRLQMIEEHKWRFLGALLRRTVGRQLGLEDLLSAIQPLEARARECYSEIIHLDSDDFIEMLVLDGCFIIELCRKIGKIVPFEADDPLVSMSWICSFFLRDLIRIENQIPFFILQTLFDLTEVPESGHSLSALALEFFNYSLQRPPEVVEKYARLEGKHLLDLLRRTFISPALEEPTRRNPTPAHVIQCISKLRRSGIALKPSRADSFLEVDFRGGTLEMPPLTVDDFMSCFLINCVAFEQCHKRCSKHFTTYATLLDYLVNTYKDVEYLCDRNIIENYFGTDGDMAKFFNNLGRDVSFDIERCYLSKLFNEVNDYYKKSWHVHWASFKFTYFRSPWSFVSALAAFVLLVLAVLQTLYSVLAYVRPAP